MIVAALSLLPAAASPPLDPHTALQIAHTGAADLALGQVDAGEKIVRDNPSEWAQWERARLNIHQYMGNWQAVIDRVADLPSRAPSKLRAWALIQAAEAELAIGQGAAARRTLRKRVQLVDAGDDPSARAQVGWLIIRSYFIDGELDQAASRIKMRLQRESGAANPRLVRLRARIDILRRKPHDAFALLADSQDARALPLRWLAGLRAGNLEPAAVEQSIQTFLAAGQTPAIRRAALIVGAEAALDRGNAADRVAKLEKAVVISTTTQDRQPPFTLDNDDVWRALGGLGRVLAHQHELSTNDGAAWLNAASQTGRAVESQALLTALAFKSRDDQVRAEAHARLLDNLTAASGGHELARQLYLHSKRFPTLADVPAPVRYGLAHAALQDDDMALAARLLATLEQPPPGVDVATWRLERAHAFILAGRAGVGVRAIDALLASDASFPFDALQPSIFALQAVGRHRDAIRFLEQLLSDEPPPEVRQNLLYWLGDSHAGLGDYEIAARLYLQSATLPGTPVMGRWARAARYQAAGALAKAGRIDDARRVYQRLLNAAGSAARRATLRQKIMELPAANHG